MRGEPEPRAKSAVQKISGRQLAAAAMVGGLSLAAGAAGRADWRWMFAGTVPAVLVAALLLRRKEYAAQNLRTPYGRVVQTVLMMGTLPLMAATLSRAAERINRSPASGAHWIVSLLLILPLLWIGSKERAAFFRAAEIFWLLVSVTVGVILLAGVFQVHGSYLLQLGEDSWESALWGFSIPGGLHLSAATAQQDRAAHRGEWHRRPLAHGFGDSHGPGVRPDSWDSQHAGVPGVGEAALHGGGDPGRERTIGGTALGVVASAGSHLAGDAVCRLAGTVWAWNGADPGLFPGLQRGISQLSRLVPLRGCIPFADFVSGPFSAGPLMVGLRQGCTSDGNLGARVPAFASKTLRAIGYTAA